MAAKCAVSKKDGACSRAECDKAIKVGKDYVWDFDNSKAYCSDDCYHKVTGEHAEPKTQPNQGGAKGGYQPAQLCRTPEDGLIAITQFAEFLEKNTAKLALAIYGEEVSQNIEDKKFVVETLKEIYLGKTSVGAKA